MLVISKVPPERELHGEALSHRAQEFACPLSARLMCQLAIVQVNPPEQ